MSAKLGLGAVCLVVLACLFHQSTGSDNFKGIQERLNKYKCHAGFTGHIDAKMEAAYRKCDTYDPTDYNCFVACYYAERGIYHDDQFNKDVLQSHLSPWFETSHQESAKKWAEHGVQCFDTYKKAGNKYPTDYKGDCSKMQILRDCFYKNRKCPGT